MGHYTCEIHLVQSMSYAQGTRETTLDTAYSELISVLGQRMIIMGTTCWRRGTEALGCLTLVLLYLSEMRLLLECVLCFFFSAQPNE